MSTRNFKIAYFEQGDKIDVFAKKLMISIATNVILLCHSTKFGNTSFSQFATLDQIDTIITDSIDAKDFRKLKDSGIDVIVAS